MFSPRSIRHCRACGAPTAYREPPDDNRERAVCSACGTIHYENPLNVVGTVPVFEGRCCCACATSSRVRDSGHFRPVSWS